MNSKQKINKEKYEGLLLHTKNSGLATVLKYRSDNDVEIEFLDTGFRTKSSLRNVKSGAIKDLLFKSVYGIGYLGLGYKKEDGKSREYFVWSRMISRCYNGNLGVDKYRTYSGCDISENFKNFSFFKCWYRSQTGYESLDSKNRFFQLDKDILKRGNKIYSEENCILVPHEINSLMLLSNSIRGKNPIGVTYNKRYLKYEAKCRVFNEVKYLGRYDNPKEAFCAYKSFKEAHIKSVAEKWKSKIDKRVYVALINYEVGCND